MIKAAQNDNGMVEVDSLNQILINIGQSDQILSEDEMSELLRDVGAKSRSLETSALMQLF
jgi:hypothetical protein